MRSLDTKSPKYILGVDPGLMTGVSLFDVTDSMEPKLIWSAELEVSDFYQTAEKIISDYAGMLEVVCESFIIGPQTYKKTQAPWSLKGWGVVEFLCMKNEVPLIIQKPVEAKSFASNEKLKAVGFWHVGDAGHANDSIRHSVTYMAKKWPQWTKNLLSDTIED